MDVRELREIETGLLILFDGFSISATMHPDRPDEIRVIGTGEDDGAPGSPQARQRFHACSTFVRFIASKCRIKRVEWRHRGGFYITENGQVAVVSGMRGTTGNGERRRAAARAFTLYGPRSARDEAPSDRRRTQRGFRIGGWTSRSLPEKLSEAAINTTVCLLSPPSGAALVTYSLLRGGSLTQSARWIALTGIAVGISSPQVMSGILN